MVVDSPQFERLPLDILHQVLLNIGSTSDLHDLIRASPIIYRYYLQRSTFFLYHCLKSELGLGIVDACSVQLSSAADFRPSRTIENVLQFLDTYDVQRREYHGKQSVLLEKQQIIPAVAFHSKIIKPLVCRFTAWAQTQHDRLTSPTQISTTETRRIQRAFYRYQLFCNLFGGDTQSRHDIGTNDERLQCFLHNFEPWAIEEILCIDKFIQDKYKDVLDDVTWPFHPDDPVTSAKREDLAKLLGDDGSGLFDKSYIIGMSSLGLTVLSSIFEAQDHVALLDLVLQHVTGSDTDWLFEATDIHIQHNRRKRFYTDGDEAQDSKEPMPFRGDGEHLPPLAWVIIWKETYSNLYGAYIKGSSRDWGYVMWDAGRLNSSGGAETLKTEWEDFCNEADDDL